MIIFKKPAKLNGDQLRDELRAGGITIADGMGAVILDGENLSLDIADSDSTAAAKIVAAHVGVDTVAAPLTPAEKLFNATGLTVAEYKALGL